MMQLDTRFFAYKLADDGRTPIAVTFSEWDQWKRQLHDQGDPTVRVGCDEVMTQDGIPVGISSVFLGINQAPHRDVDPLLFETLVTCEGEDIFRLHFPNWEQTEYAHNFFKEMIPTLRKN